MPPRGGGAIQRSGWHLTGAGRVPRASAGPGEEASPDRPQIGEEPLADIPDSHRFFAGFYERQSRGSMEQSFMAPLRREVTGLAHGLVLEIGAGNGLNFSYYDPDKVERVEATEPDSAMLRYARPRVASAHVPINLIQAPVESLPFADESFDSAVVTLVFCSVGRRGNAFQGRWGCWNETHFHAWGGTRFRNARPAQRAKWEL